MSGLGRWARGAALALLATSAACTARAPSVAPAYGPRGPPIVAWLERDPAGLSLTVLPTTRVADPIEVELRDSRGAVWRRTTRGGRTTLWGAAPPDPLVITVSWRDPRDVAGARIVLHHPLGPETAAPQTFEPIERLDLGRDGPSVEQAIRIR